MEKALKDLGDGFEALVGALPAPRKGNLRPVGKEEDVADKSKAKDDNADASKNPWVDLVERVV